MPRYVLGPAGPQTGNAGSSLVPCAAPLLGVVDELAPHELHRIDASLEEKGRVYGWPFIGVDELSSIMTSVPGPSNGCRC